MTTIAFVPSPVSDQNQLNLLQLVNLVSQKLSDTPASSTSSPSKQLIINELNEAQRKIATRSDTWTWLFKSVNIQGYDYNSEPVAQTNFTTVPSGSVGISLLSAQKLTGLVSTEKITSVTLPVVSGSAVLQAFICPEITAGGSPDYSVKLTQSIPTAIDTNFKTLTFLGNIIEPVQGKNYWLVIKSVDGNAVSVTADNTKYDGYLTSTDDGGSWSSMDISKMMYTLAINPRNYLWNLTGPNDIETPQAIHTPMGPNHPSVYVLLPMPYDYFQQSTYGNYLLGVEFFTISGFNRIGQPNIIIPMNLKIPIWTLNYKAKVMQMIDDGDMPMLPSSYRHLLVDMAVYSLSVQGYNSQDTPNLVLMQAQINEQVKFMMRDYNNKGEQYVNIIGIPYFSPNHSRVKGLNDKYRGPQRLGVIPIGH